MVRDSGRLRKRIMLNLDGTGQAAFSGAGSKVDGRVTSAAVSNVARIGRATLLEDVEHGFEQIVYYQSGVGSGAESGSIQGLIEGGLGSGLISNVRDAYGFLCNNYDYHDQIYITGFSRGAFTARSLAGLIGKVGILTKKGLDHFYEAFDYYQHPETWKEKADPCPVWEKMDITRVRTPEVPEEKDGNGKITKERIAEEKITIQAVGVWDTVGALSGENAFHDVRLGEHIKNGFHMLALNEKRAAFEPTLWEVPCKEAPHLENFEQRKKAPNLENFEQCWMPGDHSNIGGSWDDQQLADISLAWMMSRLGSLGVKFDPAYLYREFVKFNDHVKLRVEEPRNKNNDPVSPKDLYPKQWGEGMTDLFDLDGEDPQILNMTGRIKDLSHWVYKLNKTRTPMMYCHPEDQSSWLPWKGILLAQGLEPLKNTNETFHPSLRYRHYCSREGKLGAEYQGPYETKSMAGWTWPAKQPDGRIGDKRSSASADDFKYSRVKEGETVTVPESPMGYYEKLLLAMYDQDSTLKKNYGSIWKEVLGGTPSEEIIKTVSQIVKDNPKESL